MVGPSTTVFPSISNLVRPSSAASVGDAPDAITTGTAIAATRTNRRCPDRAPRRFMRPFDFSSPWRAPRRFVPDPKGSVERFVLNLARPLLSDTFRTLFTQVGACPCWRCESGVAAETALDACTRRMIDHRDLRVRRITREPELHPHEVVVLFRALVLAASFQCWSGSANSVR